MEIDAVILVGGIGKRLKEIVNDRPKPMADINGKPFLDILLNYLEKYGVKRFILCVGVMADYIENYYKICPDILLSRENKPLGTGGALKNAETMIHSNPFLVLNGDSFCPLNLDEFLAFHKKKKSIATMALSASDNIEDYGKVRIDEAGRILSFKEKKGKDRDGFINAGIYLFKRDIFSLIQPGCKCSLEYDIYPKLVNREFYGFVTKERLLDIGTPERYQFAKKIFCGKSKMVQ